MPRYQAPLRDIRFVQHELLQLEQHYQALPAYAGTDRDTMASVLDLAATFAARQLAPLNRPGDEAGCHFRDGVVTTPAGFRAAYDRYVELGLGALAEPVAHGGHGLPPSLAVARNEMVFAANPGWGMYVCLNHGAIKLIAAHAGADLAATYLPPLVSGAAIATMCLTEAHAGSDLGLLRSRAEPRADGSYAISGSKIFISGGEHDLTGNIVHIVLARLPDAPAGSKGISVFLVPRLLADGSRNAVSCGAIEHKMGLKGSATCVMNFDGATGYLIGQPNKGLGHMFVLMNSARLNTAVQGVGYMEKSHQRALEYARERLAMRAATGPAQPEREADPILQHAPVRQLLLTQKAFAEGGRAFAYWLAMQDDLIAAAPDDAARADAEALMSLMTPIAKGLLTELGIEAAHHGIQVYGGHGYIREWGLEQILRDARVATLYEGTTQIQALDLLARKVLPGQGRPLRRFTGIVRGFCADTAGDAALQEFTAPLLEQLQQWEALTDALVAAAASDPEAAPAAAVDYLFLSGYVTLAWCWARMAQVALAALAAGSDEARFYQAKLATARFYFRRLLPRTQLHRAAIEAGSATLMPAALF